MLTIRAPQMRLMADAMLPSWLDGQLRDLFPDEFASAGTAQWAQLVKDGTDRAMALGFERDQLLAYLSLEVCLGDAFLARPEHAWAAALRDAHRGTPGDLIEQLRRGAIARLADEAEAEHRNSENHRADTAYDQIAGASDAPDAQED